MTPLELETARIRLSHAPWRSRTTDLAMNLLQERPSEAKLLEALNAPKLAPAALEALSALDLATPSEKLFEAVRHLIHSQPVMSWCLVESLNRLAWYDGLRAFLSLPDAPMSSPCAYPFYILIRNKLFIPANMSGEVYQYHVNGLWRTLPVARSGDWRHPHHSVLATIKMIERHFDNGCPDRFILYLACLLLGQIGSRESGVKRLQDRIHQDCCRTVRKVAALTLDHIGRGRPVSCRRCFGT